MDIGMRERVIRMRGIGVIVDDKGLSYISWFLLGTVVIICGVLGWVTDSITMGLVAPIVGGLVIILNGFIYHIALRGLKKASLSDHMTIAYTISDDGTILYFDTEGPESRVRPFQTL